MASLHAYHTHSPTAPKTFQMGGKEALDVSKVPTTQGINRLTQASFDSKPPMGIAKYKKEYVKVAYLAQVGRMFPAAFTGLKNFIGGAFGIGKGPGVKAILKNPSQNKARIGGFTTVVGGSMVLPPMKKTKLETITKSVGTY